MNYFDLIQHYFIEKTGRGIVLGSEDARFLLDCEARGIAPSEVCLGIRRAIESRRELPRNIKNCAPWISTPRHESKAAKNAPGERHSYVNGATEQREITPNASLRYQKSITIAMQRIEKAGKESEESFKEAYRKAYRELRVLLPQNRGKDSDGAEEELNEVRDLKEIEERLATHIWQLLDSEQQDSILDAVDALVQPYFSEEAERIFRAQRRKYELFTRYNIPQLY